MSTKKLIKALGLIIVVALLAAALPLQAKAEGQPGEVWVCTTGDCGHPGVSYNTIQAGINAVAEGGTVNVAAGTYTEQLLIQKNLTLIGAGIGQTIVLAPTERATAPGYTDQVWTADNWDTDYLLAAYPTNPVSGTPISVKVSGFTFDANGQSHIGSRFTGVYFRKVFNSDIGAAGLFDSEIKGFNTSDPSVTGIRVLESSKLTLSGNQVKDYTILGIVVYGTDNLVDPIVTTTGNTLTPAGNAEGIQYRFINGTGTAGEISNNTITNGGYHGIAVSTSDHVLVKNNTSLAGAGNGITLESASNCVVQGNTIANYPWNGIAVTGPYGNSDGNLILGNTISGIHSGNTSTLGNCGWGIGMEGSGVTNTVVTGNDVSTSDAGIVFYGVDATNAAHNNIIHDNYPYNLGNSNTSVTINAENNWWGSETGPVAGTISGLVNYDPWLTHPPVHNVTQGTYHATIQAAINAATNGDTIEVAAGTYVEDVTVTNKFFNLIGEVDGTGAPVSILQGTLSIDNPSYGPPSPPEFTLIKNIYFEGTDNHLLILKNLNGGLVENCVFDGNGRFLALPNINGINLVSGPNGNSDITVTGSLFKDGLYVGIGGYADGLTVQTSEFTNVKSGINMQGNGNLVVTDSTFLTKPVSDGDSYGIRYTAGDTTGAKSMTITGSTFEIDLSGGFTPASGNYHTSIYTRGTGLDTLTVEGNTILGGAVNTSLSATLDVSPNWWGSAAGPGASQISGAVDYRPWCADAECTTFASAALNMTPAAITTTGTCTGTQTVEVQVNDVVALTAYELEVTFNPNFIEVTGVVNGGFLSENGTSYGNYIDNVNGKLRFNWYQIGSGGDPGPKTGSGSLIKITFKSKGLAGESAFAITAANSILVNWPDAFAIPFAVTGGATVNFGSVVTNTSASPNKAYCDLALAVSEAAAGHNLQVLSDITLTETITIDKALTLDLNGKVATASTGINALNVTTGGALIVNDSGTTGKITGGKRAVLVNGGGSLTLTKGTLEGPGFDGVFVYGEGSSVTVNGGTITGLYYGISGNGSAAPSEYYGSTNILITGGTVQGGETAIFHPQLGPLTINGGEIIGGTYNGIEMKAGDLTITGGTITTSADFVGTPAQTSDGNTQSGDAILIYNRAGYLGTMTVNITGGTITSANGYALREYTYGSEPSRTTLVNISGGHFTGGTPGAVWFATNTELVMELVGGDYSADPITYVYTPYSTYQFGSRWYITKSPTITSNVDQGYYLAGEEKAFDVTMNLPAGGIDLALMIFDYKLAGVTTADITKFEFFAQDLGQWIVLGSRPYETYANCTDNTGICGQFGWAPGGFGPIAAGFTNTTQFRVTFAKGFTAPLSFTLDLSGKLAVTDTAWTKLTTYTGSMDVYDKPTITSTDIQGYYLTGEQREFHVTGTNPLTGGNYTNVKYKVTLPNTVIEDITNIQYYETYPTTGYVPLALTQVGPDVVAWFGLADYGGFPMAPGFSDTPSFKVTFATAKVYSVVIEQYDVALDPDRLLVAATFSATAYTAPVISATFPTGPYAAGVPVTVPVTITNPGAIPGPFNLVLSLPDGTVFTFNGVEYQCGDDPATTEVEVGCPAIPVTLPIAASDLVITFAGSFTGDVVFNLFDTSWDPDRLVATLTQTGVVVNSGFTVTGNFSMQGNLSRAGVPVTFTWNGDLVEDYGPTGYSTAVNGTNFSLALTYGGSYTITTNQPRYLNVTADSDKTFLVNGDKTLNPLRLYGGDVNQDDKIEVNDASIVGTYWGSTANPNGNVNFDSIVNIQDLALVGGNYGLISETAYSWWSPLP